MIRNQKFAVDLFRAGVSLSGIMQISLLSSYKVILLMMSHYTLLTKSLRILMLNIAWSAAPLKICQHIEQ